MKIRYDSIDVSHSRSRAPRRKNLFPSKSAVPFLASRQRGLIVTGFGVIVNVGGQALCYRQYDTHTVSLPATQLCCYFTTNYRDIQGELEGWLLVKRSVSIGGPTSRTCNSNQRAVRAKRGASVRPNYRRSHTKQMAKWCVLGGERQLGSAELQMGNSSLIKCNSSTTNQSKTWPGPINKNKLPSMIINYLGSRAAAYQYLF